MLGQKKEFLEFNFREFIGISILLNFIGCIGIIWQIANNKGLTPAIVFEQINSVLITFTLMIAVFVSICFQSFGNFGTVNFIYPSIGVILATIYLLMVCHIYFFMSVFMILSSLL